MTEHTNKKKYFAEGELVNWELSPYHQGAGEIRGKVEGIPGLDDDWWIVQLGQPHKIDNYEYFCIVMPEYRLERLFE